MRLTELTLKELWHRKSQLISGLLAITLGIGVIVGIRSISVVSEKAVAINLDNLGANIMILPQNQGTTVVMVTHSPTAAAYGNLKIQLKNGKLIQQNNTEIKFNEKLLITNY